MRIIRFLIAIILIAVAIFFLGRFRVFDPVQGWVSFVFEPIQRPMSTTATHIARFFTRADTMELLKKNKDLEEHIAELVIENARLRSAVEQDTTLSEQFRFLQESGLEGVPTKVIGRGSDENIAIFIISKGSNDGIESGLPAITRNGILVGRIFEVNSTSAKVLLVTDSQSTIPAIIQNTTKSPGSVRGHRGLSMKMEIIPQDENIETGETITTSGIEETLPSNLVIGKVGEVTKRPGELFQETTVTPIITYDSIEFVTVLLP